MNNDLDFLNYMFETKDNKYKNQKYLLSNFEDNLWKIKLERNSCEIDFDIDLSDGGKLILNTNLLNTIKYWILANTMPDNGVAYSDSATGNRIKNVLAVFDYINMHLGKEIKISKYGFKLLNENHIKDIIYTIAQNRLKSESIYNLSKNLRSYLLKKIENQDLSIVLSENDFLKIGLNGGTLDLNHNELSLVRAYLFKEGFYENRKTGKMFPKLISIIKKMYHRKILTSYDSLSFSYPEELILNVNSGQCKEKESIYDLTRDIELMAETNLPMYKNSINSLFKLSSKDFEEDKLLIPNNTIFKNIKFLTPETKNTKRFKTVPSYIIFNTIKKAIDFHFEYGNDLIKTYSNLIVFLAKNKDKNIRVNDLLKNDKNNILVGKLKNQVKGWNLGYAFNSKSTNKFQEIREGKYLYFLLITYFGATQFVTGAIMARRQSEMISLKANESIDYINKILNFKQSKSTKNIFGVRDTIGLPIDDMALQMLKNIEKIQKILLENNMLEENKNLFTPLLYNSPFEFYKTLNDSNYNNTLDIFYDFVEVECEDNKRYYMRQHQLRRFFAMAFFWGNGFGSMDTLRWFLGHTDIQHLYHYITESTEGSVLKSVKAQYVYEDLNNQNDLKDLLKQEYGIINFNLIEKDVLEEYIEELIEEDKVIVEPEFFEDDNGKNYKILVKIKGK